MKRRDFAHLRRLAGWIEHRSCVIARRPFPNPAADAFLLDMNAANAAEAVWLCRSFYRRRAPVQVDAFPGSSPLFPEPRV